MSSKIILIPYMWHIHSLNKPGSQQDYGRRGVDSHGEDWKVCTRDGCSNYMPRQCYYCSEECFLAEQGFPNSPMAIKVRAEALKFTERAFRTLKSIDEQYPGFHIPLSVTRVPGKKSLSKYIPAIEVVAGHPKHKLAVEFTQNYRVEYSQKEDEDFERKIEILAGLGWKTLVISPHDLHKESKTAFREKVTEGVSRIGKEDYTHLPGLTNINPYDIVCIGKLWLPADPAGSGNESATQYWAFSVSNAEQVVGKPSVESVFEELK